MKRNLLLLLSMAITLFGFYMTVSSLFFYSAKMQIWWYDLTGSEPVFKQEMLLAFSDSTGTEKARYRIEVADTDASREVGLMFRSGMDADQGMLFVFDQEEPRAFWMKNTRMPLDMLFLGADSTIVTIKIADKLFSTKPVFSERPSRFVLELKRGEATRAGLKPGDKFQPIQ